MLPQTSDAPTVQPVFAITARFPLGTYRGRRGGNIEPWPTTLRLFEALTHAAGTGSHARVENGTLHPDDESVAALAWLETHAPRALHVPTTATSDASTGIYRQEGVFDKAVAGLVDRKTLRPTQMTALAGPMSWLWEESPPANIEQRLTDLAADVAYLGEAECPAVVEVVPAERVTDDERCIPTHVMVEAGQIAGTLAHGVPVPTPAHGRFEALERAYAQRYPRKRPSDAQDKFSVTQRPASTAPPVEAVDEKPYAPIRRHVPNTPWAEVFLLPVLREGDSEDRRVDSIPGSQRTPWAVAMHRALVAQPSLQYTASPVVTGRYPRVTGALMPGAPEPMVRHTNRVAIQLLPAGVAVSGVTTDTTSFAVMVPPSATDEEVVLIAQALTHLRSVYGGKLGLLELAYGTSEPAARREVSAASFWAPPAEGMTRLWRTSPVAMPETRRQKNADHRWTLNDSCLLSIGFVVKDNLGLGELPPGAAGYEALRQAVADRGVKVLDLVPLRENPAAYVHKLPAGVVAQPYRATIDLGDLVSPTTLMAIGQTRHLGGGLLRPFDVPRDIAAEWAGARR